jgi:hypothetical protein
MLFTFVQTNKKGKILTGFFVDQTTGRPVPIKGVLLQTTSAELLATKGILVISGQDAEPYIAAITPSVKTPGQTVIEKPSLAIITYPGKDIRVKITLERHTSEMPKPGDSVFIQEKHTAEQDHAIYTVTGVDKQSSSAELSFYKRIHDREKAIAEVGRYGATVWYIAWDDTWYLEYKPEPLVELKPDETIKITGETDKGNAYFLNKFPTGYYVIRWLDDGGFHYYPSNDKFLSPQPYPSMKEAEIGGRALDINAKFIVVNEKQAKEYPVPKRW